MAIRVRINGLGRIGRQVYRAMPTYYADEVDVVAVNDVGDPAGYPDTAGPRRHRHALPHPEQHQRHREPQWPRGAFHPQRAPLAGWAHARALDCRRAAEPRG